MARRKTMPELKDIIYRLRLGQSIRAISRETGTHRTIIRRMIGMANEKGWLRPDSELPDESVIKNALEETGASEEKQHPLDVFQNEIQEWITAGYTFRVMHSLIKDRYNCDESTVRRYVRRKYPQSPRIVIRRDTVAGDVMEVDFGYLGLAYDPLERRNRKTWLFSARLRHSRHTYRERVYDQKQQTFFDCHIHAFEYFGGVPFKVTSDNLKAAVIKASYEDPLVNRSYRMLAEHYGFIISPCLPYKPQHKGGVESDIKYVKKNFWPIFREKQKRLGHEIPDGDELGTALDEWSEEVSRRQIRGIGCPREIFEAEEKSSLKSLPANRWERIEWGNRIVQFDWHLQIGTAYYSVPYRYVGETVQVCIGPHIVRIFRDFKEICSHRRAIRKYQRVTNKDHGPPEKSQYLNMTRKGLLRQAEDHGESVRDVVELIFADKAVDGLRPARALISLAKKYSSDRLDAACRRAIRYNTPTYRSVKNILKKELDLREENPTVTKSQMKFAFARSSDYYEFDCHLN